MKKREILEHYKENRDQIESRLEEFRSLRDSSEKRKFKELVFVIFTSQTEAEKAWSATEKLDEKDLLLEGSRESIARILEHEDIQYSKDKSSYLVENRENLSQPTLQTPEKSLKITGKIDPENLEESRRWFAENVKGMSWKGSSHFLRNIGYGNSFAIISGHIAAQIYELGITESAEQPGKEEDYLKTEEKIREFSSEIGIGVKELDLVLWSMKTGDIFK